MERGSRPVTQDLLIYAVVGAISTVTHFGVLVALVELGGTHPVVASALGFTASLVLSYALNARYTFGAPFAAGSAVRFLMVCLFGLALNTAVFALAVSVLQLWYVAAQAVAAVLVPLSNYVFHRHWTFRTR